MFREMRRFKQQVSDEECIRILKEQPRGVLHISEALPEDMLVRYGLVQRRCNGLAFLPLDGTAFKQEFVEVLLRDVQNRVGIYLVHRVFVVNPNKVTKKPVSLFDC